MAEYVLGPDDDQEAVARALLDAAGDPDLVMWSPRPNMHPHGGVYVIDDEHADMIIAQVRAASHTEVDETVEGAPAEGGETPANDDPETPEEKAEDDADEAVADNPDTPEDEHQQGQDRIAARKAARAAARTAAEQKSE